MTTEPAPRTLADHLATLRRQRIVIITTTTVVAGVVLVLSLMQPSIYQAGAQVLLSRQSLGSVVTGTQDPNLSSDPERVAQTQVGIARLPRVAEAALTGAKLGNRSPGSLLQNSSVATSPNSDILTFSVDDPSPEMAAKLANAYAAAYTRYSLQLATQTLKAARIELQQRLDGLKASGDTTSELFRSLQGNAQTIRTIELLQNPGEVVKTAAGADKVKPTPARNAFLAGMFGLLLGIGLAFAWEALDKRVRSEQEIEQRLGLPLLSRLPAPNRGLRRANRLAMVSEPTSTDAEMIRRLRVNFEFANIDRNARKIMITSAIQEEGKSTTVSNLAVALARSGRTVALVDLDLRSPSIAGFFHLKSKPGVTDVALGRISLGDAMTTVRLGLPAVSAHSNAPSGSLSVLPAGTLPGDPGEFVGSAALAGVLDRLGREYDLVLIDAPPACIVGDAMTLSARVDALIVVARLGLVQGPTLSDLARELSSSRAPGLGIVVTNADGSDSYGYGYGAAHDATDHVQVDLPDQIPRRSTAVSL